MKPLMSNFITLLSGVLFGLGLAVSNMLNPERVLAFLDIFGVWDPTLALVMGGALLVTVPGFAWVLKRTRPWFASEFTLPLAQVVDKPLVMGAALFGMGWGLSGLCPGPAIAGLVGGNGTLFLFVGVMLTSWWVTDWLLSVNND